jgi:hypothetical protein
VSVQQIESSDPEPTIITYAIEIRDNTFCSFSVSLNIILGHYFYLKVGHCSLIRLHFRFIIHVSTIRLYITYVVEECC